MMKNSNASSSSDKTEKTNEPRRTLIRPLNQSEQESLSSDSIVLRYTSPNQPFKLHSKNALSPQTTSLQSNEVLVEVKGVALGHTDLYYNDENDDDNNKIEGSSSSNNQDSTIDLDAMMDAYEPMGHELYGVVVKTGEGSTSSLSEGEHVLVNYHVGCGICKWCLSNQNNVCPSLKNEFGYMKDGSHRLVKYCKVPHENAIVIPSSTNNLQLVATKVCTGVSLAVHATKLAHLSTTISNENGEWCVVLGAMNTVSCHLIQLLKKVYNCQIIAVIPPLSDEKETLNVIHHLKSLQTNHVINMDETTTDNLASLIRNYTNGEGADVIFDCIGVPARSILQQMMGWTGALGRRGRLVLMGYHSEDQFEQLRVHPMPTLVYEQSIVGCVGSTMEDIKDALEYVTNGTIQVILDPTRPKQQPI